MSRQGRSDNLARRPKKGLQKAGTPNTVWNGDTLREISHTSDAVAYFGAPTLDEKVMEHVEQLKGAWIDEQPTASRGTTSR